jgi:hypothetical protein
VTYFSEIKMNCIFSLGHSSTVKIRDSEVFLVKRCYLNVKHYYYEKIKDMSYVLIKFAFKPVNLKV